MPPTIWANLSIKAPALLFRKMNTAMTVLIRAPVTGDTPSSTLRPRPAPPTLPMLKARPPATTRADTKYPRPGSRALAISCPGFLAAAMIRHTFSWVMAWIRMVPRITNPKLAPSFPVNTVVCVRKPGPMAEVAIRKAAPRRTLTLDSFMLLPPFYIILSILPWISPALPSLHY